MVVALLMEKIMFLYTERSFYAGDIYFFPHILLPWLDPESNRWSEFLSQVHS